MQLYIQYEKAHTINNLIDSLPSDKAQNLFTIELIFHSSITTYYYKITKKIIELFINLCSTIGDINTK